MLVCQVDLLAYYHLHSQQNILQAISHIHTSDHIMLASTWWLTAVVIVSCRTHQIWCVRRLNLLIFIHITIIINERFNELLTRHSFKELEGHVTKQWLVQVLHYKKWENQVQGSLSVSHIYKSLKTRQPSYLIGWTVVVEVDRSNYGRCHTDNDWSTSLPPLSSFIPYTLLPLSPLVALLSHIVSKLQTDLIFILLLLCGTFSHLIYVTLLIT